MESAERSPTGNAAVSRSALARRPTRLRRPVLQLPPYWGAVSPKSRIAAALFAWFFGVLGIHRFYVGKVGTGLLWPFTFGLFGIGALVDFIMIVSGSFTDGDGLPVKIWDA